MLRSLRKRMRQKGIGMVEYAVLLAFVCGVGGVYFSDAGISGGVSSVIDRVARILGPVRDKDILTVSQVLKQNANKDNNYTICSTNADKALKDLVDNISLDDLLIEPKAWSFYDSTQGGGTGYYHMVYSTEDWSKYNPGDWVPMITACVQKDSKEFAYRVGWVQLDDNKQPKINQKNGALQSDGGAYVNSSGNAVLASTANNSLGSYNYYTVSGSQTKDNAAQIKANVLSKYNDIINGKISKPDATPQNMR